MYASNLIYIYQLSIYLYLPIFISLYVYTSTLSTINLYIYLPPSIYVCICTCLHTHTSTRSIHLWILSCLSTLRESFLAPMMSAVVLRSPRGLEVQAASSTWVPPADSQPDAGPHSLSRWKMILTTAQGSLEADSSAVKASTAKNAVWPPPSLYLMWPWAEDPAKLCLDSPDPQET